MAQEVAPTSHALLRQRLFPSGPCVQGSRGRAPSRPPRRVSSQAKAVGSVARPLRWLLRGSGGADPLATFAGRLLAPFSHSSTMVFCAVFSPACSSPDFCGTSKASLPSAHEIIPLSEQSSSEEALEAGQPPGPPLFSVVSATALNSQNAAIREVCQGAAVLLG